MRFFREARNGLGGNSPLQCVTLEKCTPLLPYHSHLESFDLGSMVCPLIILLSTKIFVIFRHSKESRLHIYFRHVKYHEMFTYDKEVWRHRSYDNCCVELMRLSLLSHIVSNKIINVIV